MNTGSSEHESSSIHSRLKRLDTYSIEYGRHRVWCRPDRDAETPAVYLVSIHGPGLPRLFISPDGVRQMTEEECGVSQDEGQVVFEDPLRIELR